MRIRNLIVIGLLAAIYYSSIGILYITHRGPFGQTVPPSIVNVTSVSTAENILGVTIRGEWSQLCSHCQAVDIGARWARASVSWASHEPTQGQIHLSDMDDYFRGFGKVNVKPVVFVSDNPSWAASSSCGPIDRASPSAFANFLGALAERYDGDSDYNGDGIVDGPPIATVNDWQLYNEPDNRWTTGTASGFGGCWGNYPQQFAQLLALSYAAVHAANPQARLVFGIAGEQVDCPEGWGCYGDLFNFNIAGGDFTDDVLGYMQSHPGSYFDAFDFHYYAGFHTRWDRWGAGIYGKAAYYRSRLAAHGLPSIPIMVTEAGFRADSGSVIDGIPGSEAGQASYLVKLYMRALAANVGPVLWFTFQDDYIPAEGGWPAWGLLTSGSQPRQAYTAYRVLSRQIEGATNPQILRLASGQEGYRLILPSGVSLDVAWGAGVYAVSAPSAIVTSIYGTATTVQAVGGRVSVALSDAPQYVQAASSPMPTATAIPPTATPVPYVQRVNAGDAAYVDGSGKAWAADRPFSVGGWGYAGGIPWGTGAAIANTADDPLYQVVRYWTSSAMSGYRFTMPNGRYEVTLKFAEVYWPTAGQRRFDVRIEGVAVLSGYDIFADAGGQYLAVDKVFNVAVGDGELTIDFIQISGYDNPMINAIQVVRQ